MNVHAQNDGFPVLIYKNAREQFKEEMLSLFRLCLKQEKTQQRFKDDLVVTIFQKSDCLLQLSRLSLLFVGEKIYSKVILVRLKLVPKNMHWKMLQNLGCLRKFVNIVKDLHGDIRATMSV